MTVVARKAAWEAAIERAGGPQAAMLYGPDLMSLLAALEESLALQREWQEKAGRVREGEEERDREVAQARTDLAAERAELIRERERAEKLARELARHQRLTDVARQEVRMGAPSRQLAAAIKAFEVGA